MNIDWADLAAACGLLLVIEGILPFLSPAAARRAMSAMAAMADSQLRTAGALSMIAGLVLLWLLRS